MKFNKSILGLAILFASCTSHVTEEKRISFIDDDELVILNGNVKQMTEISEDSPLNIGQDYSIFFLNKRGDLTETISGFHGSVDKTSYIINYDKNGKKRVAMGYFNLLDPVNIPKASSRIFHKADTGNKLMSIFKYDKENHVVEYIVGPNSYSPERSNYKYNNSGDIILCDNYNSSNLLESILRFSYDNNHNIAEIDEYSSDNHLQYQTHYNYTAFDQKNNWTKAIMRSNPIGSKYSRSFPIKRKIIYY